MSENDCDSDYDDWCYDDEKPSIFSLNTSANVSDWIQALEPRTTPFLDFETSFCKKYPHRCDGTCERPVIGTKPPAPTHRIWKRALNIACRLEGRFARFEIVDPDGDELCFGCYVKREWPWIDGLRERAIESSSEAIYDESWVAPDICLQSTKMEWGWSNVATPA